MQNSALFTGELLVPSADAKCCLLGIQRVGTKYAGSVVDVVYQGVSL